MLPRQRGLQAQQEALQSLSGTNAVLATLNNAANRFMLLAPWHGEIAYGNGRSPKLGAAQHCVSVTTQGLRADCLGFSWVGLWSRALPDGLSFSIVNEFICLSERNGKGEREGNRMRAWLIRASVGFCSAEIRFMKQKLRSPLASSQAASGPQRSHQLESHWRSDTEQLLQDSQQPPPWPLLFLLSSQDLDDGIIWNLAFCPISKDSVTSTFY